MWMTLYGAAASSVVWWAVWPATIQLVGWLLVTLCLFLVAILQLAQHLRRSGAPMRRRPFDRPLARRIGVVIVVYSVAEGAAATALHLVQQDALIFPVAVAIAGVHFFVFARVLDTWQYYVTGVLDCLAALGGILLTSQSSTIGAIPSWVFLPLLGGGVALLVAAVLMLIESNAILSVPAQATQ